MTVDLPPKMAFHMNITHEDRSEWYTKIPKTELLKEFGEQDHLVRWHMKMGWAMTYIMGIPESITLRIIKRPDWPEPNHYGYVIVPYDVEKEQVVEELGPIKV